jgi:DNA gyrase subunit A
MQVTFGANMLALVDGRPKVLNLKEMMEAFIRHRIEVITRRTQFDLDAAEKRAHILEGFIKALTNLDEIINLIKEASDPKDASIKLQEKFDLSEIQTKAILDLRLHRLTSLERDKIQLEYKDTIIAIEKLRSILDSKEQQMIIISDELIEIEKKFGDARRTEIIYTAQDFTVEDMIANEDVIVTISHKGFIKRTPVSSYRRQLKGGKGLSGAGTYDDDFVEHVFQAATHHHLLFFTDLGRCYKIKVYDLPEGSRNAKGRSLANIISKEDNEKVTAYLPVKEFDDEHYIIMVTKRGTIKKTRLSYFSNVRSIGIIAIHLLNNNRLIVARLTDGTNDIIIGSRNGSACRFRESDVRPMGRTATGVKGINLDTDDQVVSMVSIKRPDSQVIVVAEKGYGKRTKYEDFRLTRRGAKGVISMKVTEKTGKVCGMLTAIDSDDLVVMTSQGMLIRQPMKNIRTIGRNTQGVKLIRLDEGDSIADITAVSHEEEENGTQIEEGSEQDIESYDSGIQDTLL